MKKRYRWFLMMLVISLGIGMVAGLHRTYAQRPQKKQPGQNKQQGRSPQQGEPQGGMTMPGMTGNGAAQPGLQQQQTSVPDMKLLDELKQAWCLEREGRMNYILPDKTRCDCVLETHAVVFAGEETWMESVGVGLYAAMKLKKDAAIVAFEDVSSTQLYIARLNNLIEHFALPITVWTLPVSAKTQDRLDEEKRQGRGGK